MKILKTIFQLLLSFNKLDSIHREFSDDTEDLEQFIDYQFMMAREPDSKQDRKGLGSSNHEDEQNLTHEDIRTLLESIKSINKRLENSTSYKNLRKRLQVLKRPCE